MKRIGVITSGGDAPGMNAAVRAVVRSAGGCGAEGLGFHHGWKGVVENVFDTLDTKSVGGIINRGGTILRTARCQEFREAEGRKRAVENLRKEGVQGLVVIGGDG